MTEKEHPRAAAERELAATASALMLAKLARRRSHGDWRKDSPAKLFEHMACESIELESEAREVRRRLPERGPRLRAVLMRIVDEAADVLNTTAMVAEWAQRELDVLSKEGDS